MQRAAEEITGELSRVGEEKFREARGKLADVSGLESSLNEDKLAADVAGFLFFLLVTWKLFRVLFARSFRISSEIFHVFLQTFKRKPEV